LKKYKNEKFTKNLFSTKKYLFNHILKILTLYYQDSTIELKLKTMLSELDILFEKGLFKPYKLMLEKAEKMARENEKYYMLAIILEKKAIFILTEYYEVKVKENIDALRIDMAEVMEKLKYNFEYKIMYDKLFFIIKNKDFDISRGEISMLKEYISDPLFQNDSKAITIQAKFFYYSIMSHYYNRTGDPETCYNLRKTLVNVIEKAPGFRTLYPRNYLASLTNFAAICEYLGKYDEAYTAIENIKSMLDTGFKNEKINRDLWSKIIIPISETELSYYINTCKFEQLDKIIKRIMADVNRYTQKSGESRKIVMYNPVAYAYFIIKEYNEALNYLNKTLNFPFTSPEEKSYTIARIFNLIVHFELGNYDLLEHIIKSTQQYLLKKNRLYPIEKLIIDFIKDALAINEDKEMKKRLIKLKLELEALYMDIQERAPLEFFDIMSWIESKINKKEFKEVLIEKKKLS
jgi:hypothetical protein